MNKMEQHATSPLPNFGPVPLFKWPDTKNDVPEESTSSNANVKIFCRILF